LVTLGSEDEVNDVRDYLVEVAGDDPVRQAMKGFIALAERSYARAAPLVAPGRAKSFTTYDIGPKLH